MGDERHFALALLLAAAVGLIAIASHRLTERIKVPVAFVVLVAAAVAVSVAPRLRVTPGDDVARVLTVALVCILFDGGMHIGLRRLRSSAGAIASLGVLGTFLTAAAVGLLLHLAFGVGWYGALLIATAIAPTDPAMVFSVLGQREIAGRSAVIVAGESGANDPVGIALLGSLLTAGTVSGHAFGQVALGFVAQMGIGLAIGVLGGMGLHWVGRRVTLPSSALYPLQTLASALLIYGVATVAHGSGFLAVFVAGIAVGDATPRGAREIARFHGALAALAEIVAFVALGLTVRPAMLAHTDVWVPGLVVALVLTVVIRPVLVAACLVASRLRTAERAFIAFAGLKGAVPLLLGVLVVAAHVPHAHRWYGIVVIAVLFSVLVQGTSIPAVVKLLRLPEGDPTADPD